MKVSINSLYVNVRGAVDEDDALTFQESKKERAVKSRVRTFKKEFDELIKLVRGNIKIYGKLDETTRNNFEFLMRIYNISL